MHRILFALIASLGLSACDPLLDPNAPRMALTGNDLRMAVVGKTLTFSPLEDGIPIGETAFAIMRPDGTATVGDGDGRSTREMEWSIEGQGLCFRRPGNTPDPDDCRTVGWIQGSRFAVFDTAGFEPFKIADGVISDS